MFKKEEGCQLKDENKRIEEAYLQHLTEQNAKQEAEVKAQAVKRNIVIARVELSDEQQKILTDSGHIYLENMNRNNDGGKFSSYVFLNEEKNKAFFNDKNPDEFIKYGKYEMRIRDKILIENGYVTKAKVKWFGGVNYAHPYLWKANKSDTDYQESWNDPRLPKAPKEEQKPKQPIVRQKNRGRKR